MKLEHSFEAQIDPMFQSLDIFKGSKFERLKKSLLAIMYRQKDKVFASESDPDGAKWAPLSKKTIEARSKKIKDKKKKDNIKVLQSTGQLRNSLTSPQAPYGIGTTDNYEVALGTNVPYAAIHQFGGTIVHSGTDNGFGMGIEIKPYTIPIVARPFIGIGQQDEEQLGEKTAAFMARGDV